MLQWDINDPDHSKGKIVKEKGIFVNFNAVECPIKKKHRSYLVFISNDGQMGTISNPLPFVPYDSRCMECNTSQVSKTANCNLKVSWVQNVRRVSHRRWISAIVHHLWFYQVQIRLPTLALKPRGDVTWNPVAPWKGTFTPKIKKLSAKLFHV